MLPLLRVHPSCQDGLEQGPPGETSGLSCMLSCPQPRYCLVSLCLSLTACVCVCVALWLMTTTLSALLCRSSVHVAHGKLAANGFEERQLHLGMCGFLPAFCRVLVCLTVCLWMCIRAGFHGPDDGGQACQCRVDSCHSSAGGQALRSCTGTNGGVAEGGELVAHTGELLLVPQANIRKKAVCVLHKFFLIDSSSLDSLIDKVCVCVCLSALLFLALSYMFVLA